MHTILIGETSVVSNQFNCAIVPQEHLGDVKN
jgi:hypothetical protein